METDRDTVYTNVYSICVEYTVYKMYIRGGDDYIRAEICAVGIFEIQIGRMGIVENVKSMDG